MYFRNRSIRTLFSVFVELKIFCELELEFQAISNYSSFFSAAESAGFSVSILTRHNGQKDHST